MDEMRVGVLGGLGFVGTNLINMLAKERITVFAASRKNGVDARNQLDIINWIRKSEITHLVNLAAECGGIGLNKEKPAELWSSVAAISHGVLRACVTERAPIKKLIMVGTVCSYAKHCPVPFREDDLMRHGPPEPTNLAYGVAKLSSLYGAQAYARQYGLDVCNLVPVNMYGAYDHFNLGSSHVIPAIILKAYKAKQEGKNKIQLWGSGSATREFLHVNDFCRAVLLALQKKTDTKFINIGTGSEISIFDLAHKITDIIDPKLEIEWDITKPDGQPRRRLDISHAKAALGYEPQIDLDTGLKQTISWFLELRKTKEDNG